MNQRSRLSLLVVQILIVSLLVALLGRLFYLQIAAGPKYRDAALSIQSRDVVAPANRGLIVDAYGVPLALNKVGLAITIDRIEIDKQPDKGVEVMQRLAKLLKLNYNDVYTNTRLCGELPIGERAGCWTGSRYQPIPITKEANPNIALQIVERPDQFPGVDAQPISIRSYPGLVNVNAAHVLGYVGPLTEDDLTKDTGKQYYRSESIGKAGLEIQYDSYLRGIPGIRTLIVDRKEAITRESQNTQPIAGDHLVTSLDIRLQAATEKALADAVMRGRANGYTSDSGAAVVMDIRTGRILALASYPTYDPNAFEKGLTVQQASDLFSEKKAVPALNRALQGLFAPASTFKSVSVVAAAAAGYDLNASYNCPSEVQVGTRAFQNYDSKNQGRMNMKKAIAVSCDTIWYKIAFDEWLRDGGLRPKENPNDYFFKAAQSFQLTQKVGIDLPSESRSRLADRDYKKSWFKQNKDFYCNYKTRATKAQQTPFLIQLAAENCVDGDKVRAGDAVNFSIGQGDTVVTPLKLTQMYAAIGNGGTIWQALIAKAIVKTDGTVVKSFVPNKLGTLTTAPSTIKFLQSALREVIVSGTGAGVFAGFPVEVSGKTGTGQVFGRNPNGTLKDDTSWFASYAPSKKPRFAVVMMVGQGGFGASTSGVGVRQIYEAIFGVKGNKVVPGAAIYPNGKPPTDLPRISPATKPKEAP
ncbi:MAG: penicillin-binding protein 2 [Actinobacteria bacterium]|jgi:penicillin-binding protein 2|nr:penicillin-binding protein 2 [Actinomycetota bacterium]NCV82127.1 penicillin-binding protein 2 [Actinomycetota bacterium]NCW92341.1 penicillin-binding protein 2 [Actinomycetota bacterium]NCX16371.1 penicillin-binding protein 2 [Actinomycetota bacterium]NCX37811.1 penicillin-binding protein 2 [Actinomycetota bacterium]